MAASDRPPAPIVVAWVTEGRTALVIGGGSVSTRRVRALLDGLAHVVVVAPDVSDELVERADRGEIALHQRVFEDEDLDAADLVLAAIDDHDESRRLAGLCRARRIPVHVADVPDLCDFYFAAMERRGPVQIAVSTGGAGPALAGRIRTTIAAALPDRVAEATERFAALRAAVRRAMPDESQMKTRMRWLTRFGRSASWDELADLSDARIAELANEASAE